MIKIVNDFILFYIYFNISKYILDIVEFKSCLLLKYGSKTIRYMFVFYISNRW
jgi:hypothetical protein